MDTTNRTFIVCPHCGFEDKEAHIEIFDDDENEADIDDIEVDVDCSECGKIFIVARNITVTYSTRKEDEQEKE